MSYAYQWKRCDASGLNCSNVSGATGQSYTLASADVGYAARVAVSASNSAGTTSAVSAPTDVIPSSSPPSNPLPPPGAYFSTQPIGASGLPRSDSYCVSAVTPVPWEPRFGSAPSGNYPANSTQGPVDSSSIPWSNAAVDAAYWTKWGANRAQVTGHFTGTTTEIVQWAACKWGLDENTIRAEAVQETDWHQYLQGDYANGSYHSFGIMQIRNTTNSGAPAFGGMPWTQNSTAVGLDFYGAYMRSCLDGAFYDGGSWLYGGQTVQQIAAAHGSDYVLWGCVGSWYSGGWYDSGAVNYMNQVKTWLAQKAWLTY
jgi:hypothetical protein